MRIERLTVRNFRVFADVSVELDPRITVLVGTNNAGKSTLLDALAAVLGYRGGLAFAEQDFRSTDASKSARSSPPIHIELVIAPTDGERFAPGELGPHSAQVTEAGERYYVRLETRWNTDPAVAGLESTLTSLRADGQQLTTLGRFPFSDCMPLHPFGAERDLRRGLGGRWSDWGRIVAESRPPPEVRIAAMKRLKAASDYLVKNSPGLDKIRDALGEAGTVTGIGAMDVALSAAPDDVDELLRQISIELKVPGAQRGFAGERHGLGTQGALLFAVYRLHAGRLCAGRPEVSPVMTIEEPEAHLHPTAQRALGTALTKLPGQVIMTSHSPEMINAQVRPILLRNSRGTAEVRQSKWDGTIAANPRALFARCLLVAEGLEALALDTSARALGFSLHERGIEVIDARGQGSITTVWKVFGPAGFNLPVACLADGDAEQYLRAHLTALLAAKLITELPSPGRRNSVLAQHAYFVTKPERNIEEALAEDCPIDVDDCLLLLTSETHQEWFSSRAANKLSKERCNRANALRRSRAPKLQHSVSVLSDLTDHEARVERMARNKPAIPLVLQTITKNGTDGSRLPAGFRKALQWVEQRTRGNR
jgi:energy-coupling factor transporter ATP-binding protein EcfA2